MKQFEAINIAICLLRGCYYFHGKIERIKPPCPLHYTESGRIAAITGLNMSEDPA